MIMSTLPTEFAPPGLFHAWWSDKSLDVLSTSVYQRPDGSEVEVCQVGTDPNSFAWEDRRYLGLVVNLENGGWVRSGMSGQPRNPSFGLRFGP